MIVITSYFLLQPVEYTALPSDTNPFDFRSVQLFLGPTYLNITTDTDAELSCATFASLTFDSQKNGVRGKVIGLGLSGNPTLWPVKAIVHCVTHLHEHQASPQTPLSLCYYVNRWIPVTPTHVSGMLRKTVTYLVPTLGFLATDILARCLCAAGSNALINAHIEPEIITLIGHWQSNEMLQ